MRDGTDAGVCQGSTRLTEMPPSDGPKLPACPSTTPEQLACRHAPTGEDRAYLP